MRARRASLHEYACVITGSRQRSSLDLLVEFTDIIMMRKCMLGIKQRAERACATGRELASPERASSSKPH